MCNVPPPSVHSILPPQLAGSSLLDVVTDLYQEGTGIQGDIPKVTEDQGDWHFEFIIFVYYFSELADDIKLKLTKFLSPRPLKTHIAVGDS